MATRDTGQLAGSSKNAGEQRLRFALHLLEVSWAKKALGINFIDVLSSRRPGGEPSIIGGYFDAADRLPISRCCGQHAAHGLTRQFADIHLLAGKFLEQRFLGTS